MKKNTITKTLLIILTLIITGFGVSNLIFAQEDGSLVSAKDSGQITGDTEQEIISLLLELRALKLDGELFASDSFKSLKDFSVKLDKEPVGRTNPFAPIGQDLSTGGNSETNTDGVDDIDLDTPDT
ncbi:hypothetical protein COW81_02625 [Candidatus Campbellbacteria bacterium CG22_combo_CG10-13_8_21_14_all_36_13]|uniref:Uncharacterized protein n=1 Tax=Candidatus Campbellbacteria bacterium CG22_combo_CG10-13_8_21_14_all_36_13 TaxID=1974529 RepID=A0A2H0DXU1_9BACT|nr:MAG: hypothetical protein COW81_02625 [Candidatus Campbellbacteria bacterium CG22_combo_CG10-13_8_21_14_all_36_13]